jgi:GDSL-like Lipase/Acylhydrolase family
VPAAVPSPAAHRNGPGATRHRISRTARRVFRHSPVLPLAASTLVIGALLPQTALAAGPSYVALGDSYTAGPLIPTQTGSPIGCLRSTNDYAAVVASSLGASSFTNISCSGATTANMDGSQSVTGGTNAPQFSALSASTTLVTLGIGGNDIGFSSILENCAEDSLHNPIGDPCKQQYTSGGTDQLAQAIDNLAPVIGSVLSQIHQLAPNARVLLVGYPVILPNSGDGCWPVVPIAYGDVPYLRGVELELNSMLASEAAANNATYVNTYTDSIGHDACQSASEQWVMGLIPTTSAAPFHPDQTGELHMADQVLAALG